MRKKIILSFIAIIIILSLSSYLILKSKSSEALIKTVIEKIITSKKMRIEIGEISGSLINNIELNDVKITVPDDIPFINIKKIKTNYSLPLLIALAIKGDIPFKNTVIEGLNIKIIKDSDGIWNYDRVRNKKKKPDDNKKRRNLLFKNNIISDSTLEIIDLTKDESILFRIADRSRFSANLIGINKKFEIDIQDLNFDYESYGIRIRNLKSDFILAGSNCVFRNTQFLLNDIPVIGQGIINNFKNPEFNLSGYFSDIGPKNISKVNAYVKSSGKIINKNFDASMELSLINSYIKEKRIWTNLKPIKISGTNAKIEGYVNTEFGNSYIKGKFDFKKLISGLGVNKLDLNIDLNDIKTYDLIEIFNYTTYTFKVGESSKLNSNISLSGYWLDSNDYNILLKSNDLFITDETAGNLTLNGNARFLRDEILFDIKSNSENLKIVSVLDRFEINKRIFGNLDIKGAIPTRGSFFENSDFKFYGDLSAINDRGVTKLSSISKGNIKKGKIYIENIEVDSDVLKLSIKSNGGKFDDVNCKYKLVSKEISFLSKISTKLPFSGSIRSSGTIIGNLLNPRIDIEADIKDFNYKNEFYAESFNLKAKTFTNLKSLKLEIDSEIKNSTLFNKNITLIEFDTKSDNQKLISTLYMENNKDKLLNMNMQIKDIDKPNKSIDISELELITNNKELKNSGNISINITPEQTKLDNLHIEYDGGYLKSRGFITQNNFLNLDFDLKDFDQIVISKLLNFRENLTGKVSGNMRLGGTIEKPNFDINLNSDNITYSSFNSDSVAVKLNGSQNKVDIHIFTKNKTDRSINLKGLIKTNLHLYRLSENLKNSELNLTLNSKDYGIGFLKVVDNNINNIDGIFSSNLNINGTVKQPKIKGRIKLNGITIKMVQLLNELYIKSANINFANNKLKIPTTVVTSEKGSAKINGEFNFSNYKYKSNINMDELFLNLPAVKANLSGELKIKGIKGKSEIDGKIEIAQGQIFFNPKKVKKIKNVNFVGQKEDAEFLIKEDNELDYYTENIKIDLNIKIPKGTWIKSKGIKAEVDGALELTKDFNSQNIIKGNIGLIRGNYTIFGKLFKIDEGLINFPGDSVLNPQLNISASYNINKDIDVFINIQGTSSEPELDISSNPPLEETEIISYLVFGTSSDNLGTEERIYAGEFATNLAAGEVSEFLGSKFGIHVFKIQGDEEGGLSNPQIHVGSYVTEDVYIGYERSTSYTKEDSTTLMTDKLKFEWKLNNKFSMESEIGSENPGADIFFNQDF